MSDMSKRQDRSKQVYTRENLLPVGSVDKARAASEQPDEQYPIPRPRPNPW